MNARDVFHMLGNIGLQKDEPKLSEYRVVTKDGRPITGVWVDHDKRTVTLVQRDTFIETRVDT